MDSKVKHYILENAGNKSVEKIAQELGIKERKVRKLLGQQRPVKKAASGKGPGDPSRIRTVILSCLLIVALGIAAYGNSLGGKLLWDDEYHIKYNAYIRNSSNISKILASDLGAGSGRAFGFYRPVQVLSYVLDYSLWQLNPFGYHLTNMILHIMAGLAVYFFVKVLYDGSTGNSVPLISGILFIAHPVHTGAVSYVAGRADPLAATFLLLSFAFYLKGIRRDGVADYAAFSVFYILALLSKEYAVILPFLLLLYHYSFRKPLKSAPLIAAALVTLSYMFLRANIASQLILSDKGSYFNTTLLQRLPGSFAALASYVRLMVLPVNLHVEYGRKLFNPLDPMVVLGVIFLAALLIAMVRNKKNETMMFGLGWFTVSMIPVSNIYPLNAYMAEHWLYLPSVGIFLILAWGAGILIQRGGLARIMALSAVALFTVIWVVMTHNQNKNWADPISFYERAIKYSPDSVKMYNDLGRLYGTDNKDAEKAEKVLKKAIMADPKYPLSYNNLGLLYYNNGKREEGIALYRKALKLNPFYTDALNNLAMAYSEKGMYPEAVQLYQKALQTNPNYDLLYSNLGATYINMGRNNEAEYAIGIAIKLNPGFADAYFNLAILYARTGRAALSMKMYNKAVELKPAFGSPEFRKKIEDNTRNI